MNKMAAIYSKSNVFLNVLVILLHFLCQCHCFQIKRFPIGHSHALNSHSSTLNKHYETMFITQKVDHFTFINEDTFKMRYLVADQYWDKAGGPIFFYTGNEGDIVLFCNNTGFMWDIAPEFHALLVFAEHRYYGQSQPFGKDSYKDKEHLGYFTSEQALADYAVLVHYLKSTIKGAETSPVIAFGGSYGGMLAAWFRMKYPNIVTGSLAASAPIWQFPELTPCGAFNHIVTRDFKDANIHCSNNIRKSWKVITEFGRTEAGRRFLSTTFHLCKPITSASGAAVLKAWLTDIFGTVAMMDYPYPTNFMAPLPGFPVKAMCSHLSEPDLLGKSLLRSLSKAAAVFSNYTGKSPCLNLSQATSSSLGADGWSYQACTEMVMPMCSDGVNDMFEPSPWNLSQFSQSCFDTWGVRPRPDWVKTLYGGKLITMHSNIIFSNGYLDPWSGGGVLQSLSETLVAISIQDGAHHLDLRGANKHDTQSITAAREHEKIIIRKWLTKDLVNQWMETSDFTRL